MTTANGLSAPPCRRHLAATPRALPRGARPPGLRLRRIWELAERRRRRLLTPVWSTAIVGVLALTTGACAQAEPPQAVALAAPAVSRDDLSPRAACLEAARDAERRHGLPEGLLVGIALNESGLHAHALNIGGRAHFPERREEAVRLLRAAGGHAMAGCVQVNASVHARGGQDWPLDPWQATEWAASYLRENYETYGDWGMALVRWHGGSAGQMTRFVCRVRSKIDVVAPESDIFRERCSGRDSVAMARLRRNGRALLELAEAPN